MKARRQEIGMSQEQLARLAGLQQSDVSKIERGTIKKTTAILGLARALECSPEYLETGGGLEVPPGMLSPAKLASRVPIISWVQAGAFSDVEDPFQPGDADEWADISGLSLSKHAFALVVSGDSMVSNVPGEKSFPDGTVIVIEPRQVATANDFVIAKDTTSQRATFKRLVTDGMRWYLKPQNPTYPTIEINDSAIRVIGKVVEYQFRGRL